MRAIAQVYPYDCHVKITYAIMTGMRTPRSNTIEILFCASLTIGLVCLDVWPDMLGHCAGLANNNDYLAAFGLNARFFWSFGLASGAFLIAAAPAFAKRLDKPLAIAVPIIGIASTLTYAFVGNLPHDSIAVFAAICAAL